MNRFILIALAAVLVPAGTARALTVRYEGQALEPPTFAAFVLPGQTFRLSTDRAVEVAFDGRWRTLHRDEIELTAPAVPGLFVVHLRDAESDEAFTLNGFVMVPFESLEGGKLNGYRIGAYPARPLADNLNYLPPAGFVRVTRQNQRTPISPSFTLGEFTSKQSTDFPKYVALRPQLLLKLELIKAAVERATGAAQSIVVMSGYRTPYYNHAIGNVTYSRHVYGDAADIYFDRRPADGVMDDLNGDGRHDKADARWLYELIDAMYDGGEFAELSGGLGLYGATRAHGPFVHVDVRGHRARWGA